MTIETPRGVVLSGTMIDPVDSRDAAVLFSHTFLADRRSSAFFDDIARAFRGAGYATLAFDYSGHGRSGDEIITLSTMVEDLRAASGWLADQGHPRQIVHAHEFGATVALEARPPSAVTYILSSPALGPLSYDWTTIFSEVQLSDLERYGTTTIPDDSPSVRRHFTISKQTLADLSMADAEKLLTGLEVPTLITHDAADEETGLLDLTRAAFPRRRRCARRAWSGRAGGCPGRAQMGAQARTWTAAEGPGAQVGAGFTTDGGTITPEDRARTWGPGSAHMDRSRRTGHARGGPAARTWRPCRGDRARRMLDW